MKWFNELFNLNVGVKWINLNEFDKWNNLMSCLIQIFELNESS